MASEVDVEALERDARICATRTEGVSQRLGVAVQKILSRLRAAEAERNAVRATLADHRAGMFETARERDEARAALDQEKTAVAMYQTDAEVEAVKREAAERERDALSERCRDLANQRDAMVNEEFLKRESAERERDEARAALDAYYHQTQATERRVRELEAELATARKLQGDDEAERVARAWIASVSGEFNADIASLATLLRAAERRGWERACEEAARECESPGYMHSGSYAYELLARRIRSLRERGSR